MTTLSPELRSLIVSRLGAALAAAWRRQQDERPDRLEPASARDVREDEDREQAIERV